MATMMKIEQIPVNNQNNQFKVVLDMYHMLQIYIIYINLFLITLLQFWN